MPVFSWPLLGITALTLAGVMYLVWARRRLFAELGAAQLLREREWEQQLRQVEADRDVLREIVYRGQGSQQVQASAVKSLAESVAEILAQRGGKPP